MKLLLCLAFLINVANAATNSYSSGGAGSGVKLFKDHFYMKSGLGISQTGVDPRVTATPADEGHLLLANGGLFLKRDAGTTTNWEKVSASGGLELLTSSSFEGQVSEGTCTGCTASIESTEVLVTPNNKDSLKMAFSAAVGDYTIDKTTGAQFSGLQAIASCYIKTSASDVRFCARDNSTDTDCLTVSNNDTWKEYVVPFVMGSVNSGYKVEAQVSITDDVYVDECTIQPKQLTQEIAQSEFVGSLEYAVTNCIWTGTSGTYADLPVNATCQPSNIIGDASEPATDIPAVDVKNAKVGTYKVTFQGLLFAQTGTSCRYSLSTSPNYENQGDVYTIDDTTEGANQIIGFFGNDTIQDLTFRVISLRASGANGCQVFGGGTSNIVKSKFTVEYIPPKSTIVAQKQEVCSAVYENMTTQTISQDTEAIPFRDMVIDNCNIWTDNVTSGSGDKGSYTPSKNGMVTAHLTIAQNASGTSNPVRVYKDAGELQTCGATLTTFSRNGVSCTFYAEEGSNYTFRVTNANINLDTTTSHRLYIYEHVGTPTVIGKFKDIDTTNLYDMKATGSSGGSVTANSTPLKFTEVSETTGQDYWSNNDTFTPTRDMRIHVEGNYQLSSTASVTMKFFEGSTELNNLGSSANRNNPHFSGILDVTAGQAYTFRVGVTNTQTTGNNSNWLRIREVPTTKSIIKNLNDESFFKKKCQFKSLSANTSSLGNIADLTFNNLSVGKLYEVKWQFRMESFTVGSDLLIRIETGSNNAIGLAEKQTTNDALSRISIGGSRIFKATDGIVRAEIAGQSNGAFIYAFTSWMQLCELPESVIETTEF